MKKIVLCVVIVSSLLTTACTMNSPLAPTNSLNCAVMTGPNTMKVYGTTAVCPDNAAQHKR